MNDEPMNEERLKSILISSISLACKDMTLPELAAQHLAVSLGMNPKGRDGYEKIAYLYTEANGTKMHDETRAAFDAVVGMRLKGA